jgi:hypothetical protein
MGVLLSKPNTDKEYDEGENEKMAYAACSMQVFLPRSSCLALCEAARMRRLAANSAMGYSSLNSAWNACICHTHSAAACVLGTGETLRIRNSKNSELSVYSGVWTGLAHLYGGCTLC